MAITIRNKETEAMIRELGRRYGVGPSAVVRKLAEAKLPDKHSSLTQEEKNGKVEEFIKNLDKHTLPESERMSPEESRRAQDEIFDYMDDESSPSPKSESPDPT